MKLPLQVLLLLSSMFTLAQATEPVEFSSLQGEPATLDSFRGKGKWLVVKIWASDCHVCNETAHEMTSLGRNRPDDVQIVGIAVDGKSNRRGVDDYIARHQINYPTLIDDGGGAARVYRRDVAQNWRGWTPTYLLYDPSGELAAQNIGAVAESDVVRFIDKP